MTLDKSTLIAVAAGLLAAVSIPASAQASLAQRPTQPAPQHARADQAEATFAAWDHDHNRLLSLEEFRTGLAALRQRALQARLQAQFKRHDGNKSGAIEASEYASLAIIKRAGKATPPLSASDADNNHSLDFREYERMVRSVAGRQRQAAAPAGK